MTTEMKTTKGPFIFYEHGGGLVGFRGGGGGHEKKNVTKGGGYQKKFSERGGVTSNNWLVGEIKSGSTQKQMKKLNIISILFNTIFLTTFNLFSILRSKSAFHITTTEEMKHICWKSNNEYKLK